MGKAMPKSVKIGWKTYRIEEWNAREAEAEGAYGCTNHLNSTIKIAGGFEPENLAHTLLHEILHGVFHVWDFGDEPREEEQAVTLLGNGLSTVLRDNPAVARWILDGLAGSKA